MEGADSQPNPCTSKGPTQHEPQADMAPLAPSPPPVHMTGSGGQSPALISCLVSVVVSAYDRPESHPNWMTSLCRFPALSLSMKKRQRCVTKTLAR